jgi:hypothetical protein
MGANVTPQHLKIRWDDDGRTGHATHGVYEIVGDGPLFDVYYTANGGVLTIVFKRRLNYGDAYWACVTHNKVTLGIAA